MRYVLCHIIAIFVVGILFSGCSEPVRSLSPDDTVMGSQASLREREDWISPEEMASLQGLRERNMASLDASTIRTIQSSIFFEFDNFALQPSQHATLAATADYLKRNKSVSLLLEGHCDWHGTTEYNLALGDKRAATVRSCLVQAGVDSSRLQTLSKGSLEAIPNLTKDEAVRDRRVDIIVLN